ncbi:MAG: hypothetical protein JNL80_14585 [Phycisphaerae bacterium]|nr:hypothetical protein [Phycisphaerae bacterium]
MEFDDRSTEELIRLAAAGASFTISGTHRAFDDILRIATAAKMGSARICLTDLGDGDFDTLLRIAAAGPGVVDFR